MKWKPILIAVLMSILLAATSLSAVEHNGIVKFGEMGVPGVAVTATQGDKKLFAVTDQRGVYSFKDLPDGKWTLTIEMLCFTTIKEEITIAANVPFNPQWELKLLSLDEMKAAAAAAPPAPPPTVAASKPDSMPVTGAPTTAAAAPSPTTSSANQKTTLPSAPAAPGGAAAKPAAKSGFQRADLNASSTDAPKPAEAETAVPEQAGNQTAAEGLITA